MKKKKEDFKTKIKELEEKAEELNNKYLRVLAEYDNAKKRIEKDKEEFVKFANNAIIEELVPIIDDFDRAHDAAKNHKENNELLSEGIEMILKRLHKLLENNGVEKIKTVGEKFDPYLHEALIAVESDKYPEDIIVEEVSPGYIINGRLLRAAKVKISKGASKNE